jgi:hypothetical protein
MPASVPMIDRRSIPSVAIIGNDAVLVAAPATPVQLSHACLRYGFSVAVPASWGDELVATEALRQLALRNKGPVVMCVCPYARSRLLTPGPDLEPFLVSLAPPPVATARYLRAVYGEHGVHLTYIGSCPSAADPVFDARLTPDAFLADLAEHGIALSEQPLVFDSIVPPDRRRWCSLPGGVPSPEMLGSDADARTLVEIERNDVSTDLVQHIITREHVLLDLAPSLGCACSGAIGSLAARSARAAVAALEPPRAPGPVIDPTVVVSLDVPPMPTVLPAPSISPPTNATESADELLERRLDEILGTQVSNAPVDREIETELEAEFEAELDADVAEVLAVGRAAVELLAPAAARPEPVIHDEQRLDVAARATAAEVSEHDRRIGAGGLESPTYSVRRRTPPATPSRYSGSGVPKAMSTTGRPLPRAYVAKRRTPSMGIPAIDEPPHPVAAAETSRPAGGEAPPDTTANTTVNAVDDPLTGVASAQAEDVRRGAPVHNAVEFSATLTDQSPVTDDQALADDPAAVPEPPVEPRTEAPAEPEAPPLPPASDKGITGGGTDATAAPNWGVLRILMFAVLLAFAVVVLYTLRS